MPRTPLPGQAPSGAVDLPFVAGVKRGEYVWISSQVAVQNSRSLKPLFPGDMASQTRVAIDRLDESLSALGSSLEDVVKINAQFVGREGLRESLQILAERLDSRPAFTGIIVSRLLEPELMVQIDAIGITNGNKSFLPVTQQRVGDETVGFSQAVKAGNTIHISSQTGADGEGRILSPGDMRAQTEIAMRNLEATVSSLGVTLNDVVKTNAYYLGLDDWEGIVEIRSAFFSTGPTSTGIVLPPQTETGLTIQIDGMAIVDDSKEWINPPDTYPFPFDTPFRHGVRCGHLAFVGGQVAWDVDLKLLHRGDMTGQTRATMENVRRVLAALGAELKDVVKVTNYFIGSTEWMPSVEAQAEYLAHGPAITNIMADRSVTPGSGDVIEIDVVAFVDR